MRWNKRRERKNYISDSSMFKKVTKERLKVRTELNFAKNYCNNFFYFNKINIILIVDVIVFCYGVKIVSGIYGETEKYSSVLKNGIIFIARHAHKSALKL